ncbi:MAG: hypothetical protein JWN04_1037, partial [Myxococcaceae bacterium]|nr:hypothetical protein [Myxococcaceae bacterium]
MLCLALGLVPGAGCGANVADDADRGPHLVSPSPGSSANGESVLLRWSTPTSAPVHLQLCADRACKEIITERDVAGGTTSVERSGRKGVAFWHVRADGVTSPTWTFAWGATGLGLARGTDVNGDGFPDVYVGTYFVGKVAKFSPGGPQGVSDPLPFCDLSTSSVSGGFIEAAGDVNGDGFADALVH